jgi:predicted Zn-dependent peptidase
MDRTIQPSYRPVDSIEFISPNERKIGNYFSLFHLKEVPNDTCRIDFYFDAGKCLGQRGIPSFINGLLLSGTNEMTSHDIQEAINSRGGFFSSGVSMENATLTIHCLREKAVELVDIITQAIKEVEFFQNEVDEYIADQKQKYLIGLEKVGFLAQKTFQERMFYSESNYGTTLSLEDFQKCTREDLLQFHRDHYLHGLTKIAVVGNLNDEELDSILDSCTQLISERETHYPNSISNDAGEFYQSKDGALQTAVRIGTQLFNKRHDDYLDFLILNTVLGDYFGSRLMRNIREDKGYTYGIGSAIVELKNTGYFVIGTEVGKDVRKEALSEIRKEIEALHEILIPTNELELVKNYMLGQLLKSADGPYAMMDLFLSANINGMDLEVYNQAIERVQNITPERLRQLANQYLQWEDLSIISAG